MGDEALGSGAGESWPGSTGQESASMTRFLSCTRTGGGPFSGRFEARLAATWAEGLLHEIATPAETHTYVLKNH